MSGPSSVLPSTIATPITASPPPSESFFSEVDGTAPSAIDTVGEYQWDQSKVDPHNLNLVSWKQDVNAGEDESIKKRGFYALSTVLAHPTKKANPLRASRKPLPPLEHLSTSALPKPPPKSYYDSYLKSIGPLYDSFAAADASNIAGPSSITLDSTEDLTRQAKTSLPPLKSVPDAFFDPNFNLSNPSTWFAVVSDSPSTSTRESDQETQDELSTHLDTLERHLIHEITLRSSAFFSALSNLQDLHSESSSCLSRIAHLQKDLQDVGSKQARKGLDIIDAHERLRVLRVTESGVKSVAELDEILTSAKTLVEGGDWSGGLSYLEDIVHWWERYKGPTRTNSGDQLDIPDSTENVDKDVLSLASLPALSELPTILSDLTSTVASQLETALSRLLLSTLSQADIDQENLRQSLIPILTGLRQCGKVSRVEDVWRDTLTTSVREGSRKHLPVSDVEENAEDPSKPGEARGATLAGALRSMDHSRFLLLCAEMYSTVLQRLHLAKEVGELIASTLAEIGDRPILAIVVKSSESRPSTPLPPGTSELDLSDVLASACELANVRASKVVAVRSEQHAELSLPEFVEIFKENWSFVVATETLAQRMIVSLRGVTASQARTFLVSYHSIRLTKSAKLVEEEQWTQIDVPYSVQHCVNLFVEAAMSDPEECKIPQPEISANGHADEVKKVLTVEEKPFHVVKATSESLLLLGDYLKIVINLELVVTDVMSRVIEFLKSFNSRTCQVVLGAGAMRSAGLKNITAKHLALASQSLSIIISLIPYIREFIRRHLSQKQAVMLTEFDKLKRDYQDHQNEIHAKLVAIMSDRLAVHCSSLRAIDWDQAPASDSPNSYAELLVKETATLHKVLSKYLAQSTVEGVMTEVIEAIVKRFTEEYNKIELKTEDAKKRLLRDATLLSNRLSTLVEGGQSASSLETLVKEKPLPRKPVGQAMRGMINRINSGGKPPSPTTSTSEVKESSASIKEEKVEGDEEADEIGDVTVVAEEGEPRESTETAPPPVEKAGGDAKETEAEKASEPTVAVGEVAEKDEGPIVAQEPLDIANGAKDEVVAGSGVPAVTANGDLHAPDESKETVEAAAEAPATSDSVKGSAGEERAEKESDLVENKALESKDENKDQEDTPADAPPVPEKDT